MSDPNQDLDLSLLNEIADGSNEFILESIEIFLQQTPELIQLISDSITQEDWVTTGAAAHKLKPNLGFFGMLNTQEIIQDIELTCKVGVQNPQDVIKKFDQAKLTLADNMILLAKFKSEVESRL